MALPVRPGRQGAGPPYRGSASQVMLAGHRSFASGAELCTCVMTALLHSTVR